MKKFRPYQLFLPVVFGLLALPIHAAPATNAADPAPSFSYSATTDTNNPALVAWQQDYGAPPVSPGPATPEAATNAPQAPAAVSSEVPKPAGTVAPNEYATI